MSSLGLGLGLGYDLRARSSVLERVIAQGDDLLAPSLLTVARGVPSSSTIKLGGVTINSSVLLGATDGFIGDYSGVTQTRGSVAISAWGDSMTRGAGSPIREIDFASILGAVSNNPIVYNRGVGGETSTEIKARFDSEPERHGDNTVFWVGHNTPNAVTDLANVQAMIAALEHTRYIVVGPTNSQDVRDALAGAIPAANYIDPTIALIDGTGESDWASVRIDTIHLNERGSEMVAMAVAAKAAGVFDMTMTADAGISRTSGTIILIYKPAFDDYIGYTNCNIISGVVVSGYALGLQTPGASNNAVSVENGIGTDRVTAGTTPAWPLVSGIWGVGVARYWQGTANIQKAGVPNATNPTIEDGRLFAEQTSCKVGAHGAPTYAKSSPKGEIALIHIPRAITTAEVAAVLVAQVTG